jgi:hypothetical protein
MKNFSPVERSELHFSPSPEVAKSGGPFILAPGSYYLRITSEAADRPEIIDTVLEFRFVVPPKTPLLYTGSLHLSCTNKETASWFGRRDFRACSSRVSAANVAEAVSLEHLVGPHLTPPARTPRPLPFLWLRQPDAIQSERLGARPMGPAA